MQPAQQGCEAMDKSDDAFRTISEAAEELDLPQHVLRFWETRFPQIRPLKRGGGRRYYRPDDVELLRVIRHLLYSDGYTIKGVQRMLKERGVRAILEVRHQAQPQTSSQASAQDAPAPASVGVSRDALSLQEAFSGRDSADQLRPSATAPPALVADRAAYDHRAPLQSASLDDMAPAGSMAGARRSHRSFRLRRRSSWAFRLRIAGSSMPSWPNSPNVAEY